MNTLANKNILIIGGTGFIGTHLADKLAPQNHVTILGRGDPISSKLKHIKADYSQTDLAPILKNFDTIYHLAWNSTPASGSSSSFEQTHNIKPSLRLAQTAQKSKVQEFIFISSAGAIYGDNPTPFSESQTPRPNNSYGQAKFQVEKNLKKLASSDFNVTIFRPTNAIGIDQQLKRSQGIIPAVINAYKANQPITLFGNSQKDYLPIQDLVTGLACIPQTKNPYNIYNLGSGRLISLDQIIHLANSCFTPPIQTITKPPAPHDISRLEVDLQHAHQQLSWQPTTNPLATIKSIFTHHA